MPNKASKPKAKPWLSPILPHGEKELARPVGAEWPSNIPQWNLHMRKEVSQLKGQLADAFTSHTLRGFTHDQIKVMVHKYHVLMFVTTKVTARIGPNSAAPLSRLLKALIVVTMRSVVFD